MNDKGVIQIRVQELAEVRGLSSQQVVKIHIIDSDPGIPPEIRQSIFEPYYTKKANGSGLGLYVVQTLLSKLDGYIEIADSDESGAHFVITLISYSGVHSNATSADEPASDPSSWSDVGRPSRTPTIIRPREVFLLEDNQPLAGFVADFLQQKGLKVKYFMKGEELLVEARLKDAKDDLVFVLDVTVPNALDGIDIAPNLRTMHPRARIVLTSGYSDRWNEWRGKFEHLRIDFLPKPFTMERLAELILDGACPTPSDA